MRRILLAFTYASLMFLWGCWDMRQIDELGLVTAVAIDKGNSPGSVSVTIQVANPSSNVLAGASGAGDDSEAKEKEWIATQEGPSLFDAIRKFSEISSRRIMWAHNNVVIIGEDLAKEGILSVIDFFTHNPELRLKTVVVVSKGEAKNYLVSNIGMDKPSGLSFFSLESYRRLTAETVNSHLLEVSSDLKAEHQNPLLGGVSLDRALNIPGITVEQQEKGDTLRFAGAAVFKKDIMLGWLTPEEARGTSWIKNETEDTIVTVVDPAHENKTVSIETSAVRSEIKTTVVNGMPQVAIRLSGKGDIAEENGQTNQNINEMKEQLADLVNKQIKEDIQKSLEVIQKKYQVDVLHLSKIVHAQNAREWKDGLKDRWEEVFPQIPVEVTVDIQIRSSTLNQEPLNLK